MTRLSERQVATSQVLVLAAKPVSALATVPTRWHPVRVVTARELFATALLLSESDRVKLAAELLASVAPGEELSAPAWESAWLAEVARREVLEPDETPVQSTSCPQCESDSWAYFGEATAPSSAR